ncbi:VOC family protein [Micromonospora echinaurantiaca]|uniref:VOC family protein n=1 Tax=Micromonospora echinaurantiaca TaxID=47857 RepID=UPI0037A7AF23
MGAPFVWFDLTTTSGDSDSVRAFYTQLFGWTISPGMGDYQGWMTDGEQPWAGIAPTEARTAGRWIPYIRVDDLDAAAKHATALGGSVVQDKTVGPAGTAVMVADPSGAVVALFTPAAG